MAHEATPLAIERFAGSLYEAAEFAAHACLPLMPLVGSSGHYRVSPRIDPTLSATVQEWVDAAHAIAELFEWLSEQPGARDAAPIQAALALFAAKLTDLNRRELAAGGTRTLQDADWTWSERAGELQARVNLLAADGPSMDLLASVGAHLLAFCLAWDRAEVSDPASGEEAA